MTGSTIADNPPVTRARLIISLVNPYETSTYLNEYLFFHYGKPREFCPWPFAPRAAMNFQQRIARACLDPVRFPRPTRALDVGCAVGRLTFELAKRVDQALGLDSSRQFVRAARQMARGHEMKLVIKEEGELTSSRTVTLPRELRRGWVKFEVGDARDLSRFAKLPFHVVTAINLIDRLPNPRKFLDQLPGLVIPGGRLVLASPYTWMEEYTPRRNWLGGRVITGKPLTSREAVESLLRPHFRLVRRCQMPFLIREHRRKYQWNVSEALLFVRR